MKVLDNPKTKRISLKAVCALLEMPYKTVHFRLSKGYSLTDALTLPVNAPRALVGVIHGMTGTPEHDTWESMHQRCKFHPHYLKLGITVCERWHSFEAFYADMGPRPEGMSLDREKGHLGYSPGNCRWATPTQQSQNTSRNVNIEWQGEKLCVAEWARRVGMPEKRIHDRIRRGLTPEQALTLRPWVRAAT